ncbi:barnase inhibitor [Bacillus mangrovi]|uniref:Barnase inhibitor n=1 Tax=Metabacillus mangrovi TaxID=1491830 RepID=A0A7X2V6A7_9BACI|nr:barstar family protein [Metabacillus mangrovi]MTH55305.1 barnase inhibitor [Metabacillus mangrovi]
MRELIIDGFKLQTEEELHIYLKKELKFPEHYGNNLDALYDCLVDYTSLPLTVKWVHFEESRKILGSRAAALASVLKDAAEQVQGLEIRIEEKASS